MNGDDIDYEYLDAVAQDYNFESWDEVADFIDDSPVLKELLAMSSEYGEDFPDYATNETQFWNVIDYWNENDMGNNPDRHSDEFFDVLEELGLVDESDRDMYTQTEAAA